MKREYLIIGCGGVAWITSPSYPITTRGTPRKRAPKGTFDKRAYQRELMRRKRAEKKAKPTV